MCVDAQRPLNSFDPPHIVVVVEDVSLVASPRVLTASHSRQLVSNDLLDLRIFTPL